MAQCFRLARVCQAAGFLAPPETSNSPFFMKRATSVTWDPGMKSTPDVCLRITAAPKALVIRFRTPNNPPLSVPKIHLRNAEKPQEHLRTPKKNSFASRFDHAKPRLNPNSPLSLIRTNPHLIAA